MMRPGELRDVAREALDRAAQWRGAAARCEWWRQAQRGARIAAAREAIAYARGARIVAEYAGAVLPW